MKPARTSGPLMLAVLSAIAASVSPLAMAQNSSWQNSNWYGGVNLGQLRAKIDDARIISGLSAGRFTTTSISDDDRDTGYKIFGGFQFNKNFSIEAGVFDLGKFGFTANTIPVGTFSGNTKMRGLNLDVVGILPVTDKFSVFGRAGLNHAEAKTSFSGTGLLTVRAANASKRDTNYKAGAGLEYAFTPSLSMRVELERYRINDAVGNKGDIDLASVGLVYRFGGRPAAPIQHVAAAPVPRVAAPQPVVPAIPAVPAPEPELKPAAPPQPTPPLRVMFVADAFFDFDQAIVKPAGRQSLDKFIADLRGLKFDRISVTGHTDRLGSNEYNLSLSTRRTEVVKAYLVDPAGIPSSKISSKGEGELQPETKPDQCKGEKATKELIACLQPDRRVEIEVSGTK